MNYQGTIIEESLKDKSVLGEVKILSTRVSPVTEKDKTPWLNQWTLHKVEIEENKAEAIADKISAAIDTEHTSWYADYRNDEYHYIIFPAKVFKIERSKKEQYDEATKYGIMLGIPDYQVDFSKYIKIEEEPKEEKENNNKTMEQEKKLYRSRTDRILLGVCGGLGKYLGVDPMLIRILFILLTLADGVGLLIYVVLAIVVPSEPGEDVVIDRGQKVKEFADEISQKAKEVAGEIKVAVNDVKIGNEKRNNARNIIGIIIIVAGLAMLMDRFFPFYFNWFSWAVIWPALIIVLGVYLIVKK